MHKTIKKKHEQAKRQQFQSALGRQGFVLGAGTQDEANTIAENKRKALLAKRRRTATSDGVENLAEERAESDRRSEQRSAELQSIHEAHATPNPVAAVFSFLGNKARSGFGILQRAVAAPSAAPSNGGSADSDEEVVGHDHPVPEGLCVSVLMCTFQLSP